MTVSNNKPGRYTKDWLHQVITKATTKCCDEFKNHGNKQKANEASGMAMLSAAAANRTGNSQVEQQTFSEGLLFNTESLLEEGQVLEPSTSNVRSPGMDSLNNAWVAASVVTDRNAPIASA